MSVANIREIGFRRKFNLGNYETMDIELIATISEGQNADEIISLLDDQTKNMANAIRGKKNGNI